MDLAQIGAVAQDGEDGFVAPGPVAAGAVALLVEPVGDGAGAQAFVPIQVEHDGHQWGMLVGDQVAGLGLAGVAERVRAAAPAAPRGGTFHARDDAVDDDRAFVFGEHRQQLHGHATDGGLGVEVLGGGAERHASTIELLDDVDQALDGTGEAVDPVDQQEVVDAKPGLTEGLLESWAVERGAALVVGVGADDRPVLLAGDVGVQSGRLHLDGVRLVLVVG